MLPNFEVHLVKTADDVDRYTDWVIRQMEANEVLAVDTETTGLDWLDYNFVRLFQIANDHEGWAIPVQWWGKIISWTLQMIVDHPSQRIVMQNAGFDMHAIRVSGWPVPAWSQVHDTRLLLHLHRSDLSTGLKSRHTADLVGKWIWKGQSALKSRARDQGLLSADMWKWIDVETPEYWGYGILDTIITRRLYDALNPTQSQFADQYATERRYAEIMHRVEIRGIRVDSKYTTQLQEQLTRTAEQELFFLQDHGLANPNSNKQLIALLEEDFSFVPTEFTETGQAQVNKQVLEHLAEAGGLQADVVQSLISYKRATKWRSAYADIFANNQDRNGRIHCSINTIGAKTGRSSVTRPALQTLPGRDPLIRKALLPNKGETWWSIDYSNQEPRALAHYGRSKALQEFFTQDGDSIHDFVAGELFGSGYTNEQRHVAKIFGLSRSYGAGAESISKALQINKSHVEGLLDRYDTLVGLAQLNAAVAHQAEARQPTPYVVTSGGRRVYSHPEETFKLVNYLCQGSGADMLKQATIRLDEEGLADFIMVPVHDEICFSFPEDEDLHLSSLAASVMRDDTFSVPMPVTAAGPGKSWGALYEDS